MVHKRLIPLLMLHKGELYNSVQFSDFTYIGDPLITVKIFGEKQAEEICIIDIDPSRFGTTIQFNLLKDIASECFMPLSYGGGVNNVNDANRILNSGYEKIIINSAVHQKGISFVKDLTKEFGSSTIIVSVDYKMTSKGLTVFTNGGQTNTGIKLIDYINQLQDANIGELILNSIDRDGMMTGLDIDSIRKISTTLKIPLIATGGVGGFDDLSAGLSAGANGVASSSLFLYKGPLKGVLINYPNQSIANQIKQRAYEKL